MKAYWTALKKLLNKDKVPIIPPISHNNSFVTDIKEKCNIFNMFFEKQCNIIKTKSTLPEQDLITDSKISDVKLSTDKLLEHIRGLNLNKAHGHDEISVRMIKMCDTSIVKPLMIIYKNCLRNGYFPLVWKKANVIPIHKKDSKLDVKNYRPVSILPIFGKIFEKINF